METDAMQAQDRYDVVVVGGGAAGLNGALMLARSRRSVLVVDAGEPRNLPAEAIHGLLGHDGTPPAVLLERGRDEVRRYGGEIVSGCVTAAAPRHEGFVVTIDGETQIAARRLLVTTGLVDELPDVPGLADLWGRDVLHCPYCHGWEVRDRAIGILARSAMSLHHALLFRQLTDDVVYFTHETTLDDDAAEQLAARGIAVVEGRVSALETEEGRLTAVRVGDREPIARDALVVAPRMVARAGFLADLGLRGVEHPSGAGTHVPADPSGQTDVPGVWAAGNVSDLMAQVGASAAAGALAGARINADLVAAETAEAVTAYRAAGEIPVGVS